MIFFFHAYLSNTYSHTSSYTIYSSILALAHSPSFSAFIFHAHLALFSFFCALILHLYSLLSDTLTPLPLSYPILSYHTLPYPPLLTLPYPIQPYPTLLSISLRLYWIKNTEKNKNFKTPFTKGNCTYLQVANIICYFLSLSVLLLFVSLINNIHKLLHLLFS